MRYNSSANLPLTTQSLKVLSCKSFYIKPLATAAIAIVALGGMTGAHAKTLFKDTSVTLLHGGNFELLPKGIDSENLTTLTLEHASTHDWGGVFFFVDRHQGGEYDLKDQAGNVIGSKDYKETFGKFSPKFKVASFNDGLIKQVNLAGVYEFSSNSTGFGQDNYWAGVGVDLNLPIPGMKYASATLYHSFNDVKPDDQKITLTAAWERDKVLIDGYVDFAFNSDTLENNIHFNPQVKYNLQEALGIDNRLEVGGEYSYWKNKFGVDGVDEHAVMALVKYHF
ncbi:DUF5020 domain-containing protein [Psychrobacter sp. DAB_AL32B]|uniref:DUF5020 domain-containing protein n=1 Tax=Psychrobacter sp. DAB_AL32B TaxID=1028414 RepID=UPI0020C43544|nr:DUF5020 domain-containing protein [Psychrobacter sp. DAB_AL32B]